MANAEDLALVSSGAADLSGCDLSGADLSKLDLSNKDFSHANLMGTNVTAANLSKSKFFGALVMRLNADSAVCVGSDFSGCFLQNASFARANLQGAVLTSAQLQNVDFSEASLRGTNFGGAALIGTTRFEGAEVDQRTSFEGARGAREFSRLPVFAGHRYESGTFRAIALQNHHSMVAEPGSFTIETNVSSALDLASTALEPETFKLGAAADFAADNAAQRIVSEYRLFAGIARYAATSIRDELQKLDSKIPNEPDALSGYQYVRETLQNLQMSFENLSETVTQIEQTTSESTKLDLAKSAVSAAKGITAGFVGWLDQHGPKAGGIVAELGLAGVITGTLAYFTGVSPTLAFSVTVAALSGKSIWEAIVLFAPNKKDESKQ